MEIIIDEDGQKCAEIFVTKYGKYIFLCVHCNKKFQSFDTFQSHCLGHIKLISTVSIPTSLKPIKDLAIEGTCYQNIVGANVSNIKSENIGEKSEEDFIQNKDDLGEEDSVKVEIFWCDENKKDNFSEKVTISCPYCKLSSKQHDQELCDLIQNENLKFKRTSFENCSTEPQIDKSSQQISNFSNSSSKNVTRKHRKLASSPKLDENYRFKNSTVEILKKESKNSSDYNRKLNKTRRRTKEISFNDNNSIDIITNESTIINASIKPELAESNDDIDITIKGRSRIFCSHCNYDFKPFQNHDQNKCAEIQKVILRHNRDYDILSDQGIHLCKECPRYFETNMKLAFHRRAHYNSGICPICNKKFISLERHIKSQHPGVSFMPTKVIHSVKSYHCRYCEQSFVKKAAWKNHENVHENESLKCKTCGKVFKRKLQLKNHVRTHTGERPYCCKLCPAAFALKRNLNSHHIYKHTDEKKFACRHEGGCGKTFKTDPLRNQHERRHIGEKCFQCELCGMSFTTKSRLRMHNKKKHMDYNDRKHHCQFCEKKFIERVHLVEHTRTHTGEKPMKCDKCSSSFAKRSSLREHQKLHNPEKQHVCQLCGRSFAQLAGYSNHMKNHP